jgi:hypothetical protein
LWLGLLCEHAAARSTKGMAGDAAEPASPKVRLAVSKAAAKRLHARRVRRLLAIELGHHLRLAGGAVGPLGDDLVRVWIDVPRASRALIEVRRTGRPLAQRSLNIKALTSDAAARLVAIVTSEMVRVQARAPGPPRSHHGARTVARASASLALRSDIGVMLTPGQDRGLWLGSGLVFEHRLGNTSQQLYGRQLTRDDAEARWIEFGVAAGLSRALPSRPRSRFNLGVQLGAANIRRASDDTSWSPTLAARIGGDHRVTPRTRISLAIQPGIAFTMNHEAARAPRMTLGIFAGLVALP